MMNSRKRLRRTALLLAPLVLAAIVTGVAASAAKTVIPKQLTGSWQQENKVLTMVVSRRGKVKIYDFGVYHARFSRVTAHRLSISGLCSGTATYRWTITKGVPGLGRAQLKLKLKKIHDACKSRVEQFAGTWRFWKRDNSQP
jgi:hypothetical protein